MVTYKKDLKFFAEQKSALPTFNSQKPRKELKQKFRVGDNWLGKRTVAKELSFIVEHRMKASQQCDAVATRKILFFISLE